MRKAAAVIIFDGECELCNGAVRFIIKHDPKAFFLFASMQSESGQALVKRYRPELSLEETIVLIKDDKSYIKAKAVLEILTELPKPWSLLYLFNVLPKTFLDYCYDIVARNRHTLLRKSSQCPLSHKKNSDKFLG